jgi:paraquat-inducible protein B
MSKTANKKLIGIFVIVAVGLVFGAILMLGSGRLFRNYPKYVMYFQGSVKGLLVGSPVLFRGVKVGSVIEIAIDLNLSDFSILIPVYVELGEKEVATTGYSRLKGDRTALQKEYARTLIDKGLRAQLEIQSVVTGQLLVSLDFHPETKATFVGKDKRYVEIPTIPTKFQQLTKRLENIPIEDIFQELRSTLAGIHRLINSPQVATIMASGSKGVEGARRLIEHIDGQLGPLARNADEAVQEIKKLAAGMNSEVSPRIKDISEEAVATLKRARTALESIEGAVEGDEQRLSGALKEIEGAARSIRNLADELSRQPESVIWGKKEAPSR